MGITLAFFQSMDFFSVVFELSMILVRCAATICAAFAIYQSTPIASPQSKCWSLQLINSKNISVNLKDGLSEMSKSCTTGLFLNCSANLPPMTEKNLLKQFAKDLFVIQFALHFYRIKDWADVCDCGNIFLEFSKALFVILDFPIQVCYSTHLLVDSLRRLLCC